MKNQIVIQWNQAQEISKETNLKQRQEQAKYLNEFRTSFCDMFTILDWQHYADKTNWTINKLREYAKFDEQETTLKNYIYSFLGSEVDEDDLYNFGF